ncbi:MAG: D-glycero-beta-D-manno-heptose 1-phosphate adenylyltransferase [Planctomycetes bacterium]|nr:D-glycero-beta-D-manno-heptose 1-phosphate adenylyltransferase [Planctomycetota bacterium]
MSTADLLPLIPRFQGLPVLLVGDLMLDRYVWGDVSRISPEAPVPVLKVTREETRLGGSGSVLANLSVLGAEVRPIGVIGPDQAGDRVIELLADHRVVSHGVLRDQGSLTTQKTRLVARTQQLLRMDHDTSGTLPGELEQRLLDRALELLDGAKVVLVSDYGRGVLTGSLCRRLAAEARRRGVPVLADPNRDAPFERYAGATAITPNRNETTRATGIEPVDDPSFRAAAQALIERLDLEWVAVTLDKDGVYLLRRGDARGELFPAKARAVFDVAGAGDMVLATLGLSVAAGAALPDAVHLANIAAGLEVERLGVSPIHPEELEAELQTHTPPVLRRKIVTAPAQVTARIEEARRKGHRVVFTNGCFDLLHAGHVHFLQGCRAQGDFLVVGLNTDASIRGLKGPDRPVLSLDERATVLAGLEAVDMVVPFDEPTPVALIERVRPDVLCKGEDYRGKVVVGRELVEGWGGRVELVPLLPGKSTTNVIDRIERAGGRSPVA